MAPTVDARSATPTYRGAVGPGDPAWNDALAAMRRLAVHHRAKTTDQAEAIWREPADKYRDPQLWQREMAAVHHQVPLPLALSCELTEPGAYKAMDVAGTPVLITRGADGAVHAMLNVCRHRGSAVVENGAGVANAFSCPYHAWTYDTAGCLRSVYGESTFGAIDRSDRGLLSLPAEERAGVVFVGLTRDRPLEVDHWLGDALPVLEGLGLAGCHLHSSMRQLDGPNWKIVLDGYLENYHFGPLHTQTVFKRNLSNIAAIDIWGPHIRNSFALRPIAQAITRVESEWDPTQCVGLIMFVFPGLAIAGGLRNQVSVSLVLPGTTVDTSVTYQSLLLRNPPADEVEAKEADHTSDWFYDVVREEDYATCYGIQRGLEALAGTDLLFGRNEPGVQHLHRTIDRLAAGAPVSEVAR
ncbi:MAG TPA: aromatic ring-hydroxylating dioxygenase subunit alpha [Sporichthyaceae bacterium]